MRRLPPNKIEQNLNGFLNLLPDETEELLQRIDQPLKETTDTETVIIFSSSFLISLNHFLHRDENIYYAIIIEMVIRTGRTDIYFIDFFLKFIIFFRSPWSNKYDPPPEDGEGFYPSERIRTMEIEFNELFDEYRAVYFEGGTSSVYLWDLDNGFAGCFLIKKSESIINIILSIFH
jgi:capping protein (actin filament) muscle Z-line, beta